MEVNYPIYFSMKLNFSALSIVAILYASLGVSSAANTNDHYVYPAGETDLSDNLLVYTGDAPVSILIEGDGSSVVNGAEHSGFQFVDLTEKTTITVKNIAAFKNFIDTSDKVASTGEGGAVFYVGKNATLNFEGYSIDNRLLFDGSSAKSDGHNADGGAISVQKGGVVGDVYADFSNNTVSYPSDLTAVSSLTYARGAAISLAGTVSPATMGNVYGTFTNNSAEYGGAIYLGAGATIGSIEGSFIANHAESGYKAGGYTGGSAGGAIRFFSGTMSAIKADFIANTVHAVGNVSSSTAQGGAIALYGSKFANDKGTIEGDFLRNIAFSEYSTGLGGAFHLVNQTKSAPLYIADSSIIGNMAGTANKNAEAFGGAFYISLSDSVYIDARSADVLMRDNYELVGGTWNAATHTVTGGVRDYNAIYAFESTITLRAQNSTAIIDGEEVVTGHKITIDDSIESINDSKLILDSSSSQRYDVEINAEIRGMDVTVQQGGLILGSYEHKYTEKEVDYSVTTTGAFIGGSLTIAKDGLVNTKAENISTAASITNAGLIEFEGGTLTQGINTTGVQSGSLAILGTTSVSSSQQVYADTIVMDDILKIAENATVDVKTILFKGADMNEINDFEHIVLTPLTSLDFDTVRLDIDRAMIDDYFDLIISDGSGNVNSSFDQTYNVEFYLAGKLLMRDYQYVIEEPNEDGGLRIRFLIPEPSTASLSLVALIALMQRRRRKK